MIISIEKQNWVINNSDFQKINHVDYNNLILYNNLGELERLLGFLKSINKNLLIDSIFFTNYTHSGYLPINCSYFFKNVIIVMEKNIDHSNLLENIKNFKVENIELIDTIDNIPNNSLVIDIDGKLQTNQGSIIISNKNLELDYNYKLWNNYYINFNPDLYQKFYDNYSFFIEEQILNYDNLINLCIMVKNAGPQFENMLKNNLQYIDQWTILDTGSTDETIEIINRVLVGKKKGKLYQEPFINFRDSRNRLLELAGEDCKFTLMLDDTYIVRGDLKEFLTEIRSDQFADSFTLIIKSDDTEYGSNRILKSNRKLKYINKIHEVITDKNNINVVIPIDRSHIIDGRFDYMEKRTMERKQLDLKLLYEELEEDPNNSRTHYYLGQTYNLLEDYDNAIKWFKARVEHPNVGFIQEKVDASFEMARCANFKLNRPWEECEKLYNQTYELDKSRPESQYFIGIHYYLENNYELAYKYFKKAYEIGYPAHCQYSLKPTLSFYFCPKFLTRVCYQNNDYKLGEEVALFYMNNNPKEGDYSKLGENAYDEIESWYKIYQQLNFYNGKKSYQKLDKPIFCLIIDGGFKSWNGSSILYEGVGGSETWAIETARWINKTGNYRVFVFCKCSKEENFEGVEYVSILKLHHFLFNYQVDYCFISRYSEYIPLAYKSDCKEIYFIIHDLTPSGIVIPIEDKLKTIYCLTNWHRDYFIQRFPMLENITQVYNYGINHEIFHREKQKKKYNFIYSSTANRGLLPLLQIWPQLYQIQPLISLDIYCDLNNSWVNNVAQEQINEIKRLLLQYSNMNINYYGWVDKETLSKAWSKADIWFYPCIFQETFCLTALEAAISETLAITNGLGSLVDTVGDRGIYIPGDPFSKEWQNQAIVIISKYLENIPEKQVLIRKNLNWAIKNSWENQTSLFLSTIENKKYLIYLTVFYNKKYLKLLELLIESLFKYGNLKDNIDIIIYTDSNLKKYINKIDKVDELKIKFYINDTVNNVIKACKSRFEIFDLPNINIYNKILYLDSDIIIQNDISKVFDICNEDKLYVVGEKWIDKEGVPYWGSDLMKSILINNDEIDFHSRNGFNDGVMVFQNTETMKKLFKNVLDDTVKRNEFINQNVYIQPFINYHTKINNLAELDKLKEYSINIGLQKHYDLKNYTNFSILHFYFGVKEIETKIEIMKLFLDTVNQNKNL